MKFLSYLFIAVLLFTGIQSVLGASITAKYPAGLNNFSEGDIIEEEDWNAIELDLGTHIGSIATGTPETINWIIRNASFASTSLVVGKGASTTINASATGTSTFQGGLTIETSGFVYDFSTNRVGIGTSTPGSLLTVDGTFAVGTNGVEFVVSNAGIVTAGTWQGTAIASGFYATASIDGDDINSNIAGANLTLTAGSPDVLDLDATLSALTGITSTGVVDFSGASLEIPNSASPTVDAIGEIALDTTDNQLLVGDSAGVARVFARAIEPLFAVTVASTSVEFVSGGLLSIAKNTGVGRDIVEFKCHVESGTSVVINVTDLTNDTETITCATTQTTDSDVATNSTFTANEFWSLEFGTITGDVDYLIFEALGYITVE